MEFPKLPLNIKPTGSISTAGNVALTAPLNPSETSPEDLTTLPVSIPFLKSNLSLICGNAALIPQCHLVKLFIQPDYSD